MNVRYYARSASDKTDDWPYWYVADGLRGGLNVTVDLAPEIRGSLPFLLQSDAVELAMSANQNIHSKES